MPPLLAIAEGRKVRARRAPTVTPTELKLHMTVAALLRDHCIWEDWTHFPAGELRDKGTARKLKQMGMRPFWPDFLLLSPEDRLHCLELKRVGRPLTDGQSEFRLRRVRRGTQYAICRTLDDVLAVFEAWGCLRVARP
jgi:hypothetical protein